MDLNIGLRELCFQQYIVFLEAHINPPFPLNSTKVYDLVKRAFASIFDRIFYHSVKSIYGIKNLIYSFLNKEIFGSQLVRFIVTLLGCEKSFGFISIENDQDRDRFHVKLNSKKNRIEQLNDLYPQQNALNCAHYSTILWFKGCGQIKPILNKIKSVSKLTCCAAEKLEVSGVIES